MCENWAKVYQYMESVGKGGASGPAPNLMVKIAGLLK